MAALLTAAVVPGLAAAADVRGEIEVGAEIWQVRAVPTAEFGVERPAGLLHLPEDDSLVVFGRNRGGLGSANLVARLNLEETAVPAARLQSVPANPISVAFDAFNDRLVLLDVQARTIGAVDRDTFDRSPDAPVTTRPLPRDLVSEVGGMAVDPATGSLFVLDPAARRIVKVVPQGQSDGRLDPQNLAEGRVELISLDGTGFLQGLALDPGSGNLYSLDTTNDTLVRFDQQGQLLELSDISSVELQTPEGLTFAPSGDPTDDPNRLSLYIADGGRPDGSTGAITEVSLAPLAALAMTPDPATLEATIDTSQLTPPSPDSAGLTYLSDVGHLLMADSEVNEMPIYAGVNLFELTTTGNLQQTGNTLSFSNEPTGVSFNPANRHLFVSDDNADEVTQIDPGGDGIYGTTDDSVVATIDMGLYGSTDAEGVALDTIGGNLFVVDGIGREVYRISPGPNGVFDGGGDDRATSFDLEVHGIADPEGIAFSETRGTVFIVDRGPDLVHELTIDGALVRIFDYSGPTNKNSSGITLAPGSLVPAATHYYISDRGVDNNSDPNENDGRIYEFSVSAPAPNAPPYVYAGPDQDVIEGEGATLDGVVADDGPSFTTSWAQISGPATASIANPSSPTTAVSFPTLGVYEFELSADDGTFVSTDRVIVTVISASGPFTIEVSVSATSDDAEQRETGSPILSSSDLDLMWDRSRNNLIVGVRWNDIGVPQGATITNAYVQFKADEASSGPVAITIEGQASDNAPTFTSSEDITQRPRTTASVGWSPPDWTVVGEIGPGQRTSDVSAVIQEIIDRPGWSSGNSLALLFTGTGERVAESFDGSPSGTPLLHFEYSTAPQPATVSVGVSDGVAGEPVDDGEFVVSRSGSTVDPLLVVFSVGGTASAGDDYVGLGTSVTIPAGQASVPVAVDVVDDGVVESDETVVLTIQPDPEYVVAAPPDDSATITIGDDDGLVAQQFEVRVNTASDDAEERSSGSVNLTSSDLELVVDGTRQQLVGTRFAGVDVPRGAQITAAWVQFQTDETSSDVATLTIRGQASDNPPTFLSSSGNISARPMTAAQVSWSPNPWGVVGEAGVNQRTADLTPIIQEIVDRPGWAVGNAVVVMFSGTGTRTAESYNGSPTAAPLLHIEFDAAPIPNRPPEAVDDAAVAEVAVPVTIDVTANDTDPDNNLDDSTANTHCVSCSDPTNGQVAPAGPGSFTYTSDPGFLGNDSFVYEVCDTEGLCDTGSVTVTVTDALPQVLEVRVSASSDDAEERSTGQVALTSSDLELVVDGQRGAQLVGMRFAGVNVPVGAVIQSAWIQFQTDETDSGATNLTISGQAADHALTFDSVSGNISSRPSTGAAVAWSPAPWTVVGEAAGAQQTPDISSIIQEIVARPGWSSGNAIVVTVSGTTGTRVAESYNGSASAAPLLHVEYTVP